MSDSNVAVTDLLGYDGRQLAIILRKHFKDEAFVITGIIGIEKLTKAKKEELAEKLMYELLYLIITNLTALG